jgi:hypothetical protein
LTAEIGHDVIVEICDDLAPCILPCPVTGEVQARFLLTDIPYRRVRTDDRFRVVIARCIVDNQYLEMSRREFPGEGNIRE